MLWPSAEMELPENKLDILQQFNMQLVVALNIDESKTDAQKIQGLKVSTEDRDFGEQIAFVAFVRDIHFEKGL